MGGEWAAIGALTSLASAGLGAYGSSASAKAQAARARTEAKVGRTQADQVETGYRDELASTLSNIRALRATSGVGADSPTELAIISDNERRSERQRNIEVGNRRMQANQRDQDAKLYSASANMALFGGALEGLTGFAKMRSGR